MSNNIFYKALATVSTAGIIVIAGMQVSTALKKTNTPDDQLAKTMVEIKNARKDALSEVKAIRTEIIKELNGLRSNTLNELKGDRKMALMEVKTAKNDALKALSKASGDENIKTWLILKYGGLNTGFALNHIPMKDYDQCQLMGAQWKSSPRTFEGRYNYERMAFACLEE